MNDFLEEEIKNLKNKIKDIYYIKEYDAAKEFDDKLEELKEEIKQILNEEDEKAANEGIELRFDVGYKQKIINKIVELNYEIDQYMVEVESRIEELNQKTFETRIKEFIQNINQESSTHLINELKTMVEEAKKMGVDDILFSKLDELSSKALLEIFIEQIKNGENIDFDLIREITEEECFINEVQQRLIEIAEQKNETESLKILKLCRELSLKNLNNKELWTVLSGVESIHAKQENIEEKENKEVLQYTSQSTDLIAKSNKKSI